MHIAFWVGLRIFLIPMVLFMGALWFQSPSGQAQASALRDAGAIPGISAIDEALRSLESSFQGIGGHAKAYVAPIANAKFTSGRTLSGGGFIRP